MYSLGVALIEIVTDPVFTSSCQAAAFVDELASLLRHLDVCSSNMSTGEMRVDINVSIGPSISQQGPVVEIKNVNSLRAIRYAIGNFFRIFLFLVELFKANCKGIFNYSIILTVTGLS